MIHYQLRCKDGHGFDGWFKDSTTFDKQASRGLIECPACGGTSVERALMAPAVASRKREALPPPANQETAMSAQAAPSHTGSTQVVPSRAGRTQAVPKHAGPNHAGSNHAGPNQAAPGPLPAQMLAMLQRMRAEVEKHCDYVGSEFADEARRIHRGEVDERPIYGETSEEQAESLADEGISVARIPWVPRADG